MPLLGRLSVARLATWLVTLLVLYCCTSCTSQEAPAREVREPRAAGETTSSKDYDRFLLVRQDLSADRRKVTQTIIEARLTPEGLAYRDLCETWSPDFLAIVDGKLYTLDSAGLVAIDLASGEREHLPTDAGSHTYAGGTLVTVSHEHVLRIYDLAAETQREVLTLPSDHFRGDPALSPDGKRLAFFLPTTRVMNGPAQLQIIDLQDGEAKSVGSPVTYGPGSGIFASRRTPGSPLVWADERTVVFLQTPELNGREMSRDGLHVMAADVVSSKVRKICDVPEPSGAPFYRLSRPSAQSDPLLLVGERAYSIDLRRGALSERVSLGGGFRFEPAQAEVEDQGPFLWHEERQLGQVRIHDWPVISPDGKKVIWIGGPPYRVHCYDADEGIARDVDPGFVQGEFLWFSEEDLEDVGQEAGTKGPD